jgi:hypothetical protein
MRVVPRGDLTGNQLSSPRFLESVIFGAEPKIDPVSTLISASARGRLSWGMMIRRHVSAVHRLTKRRVEHFFAHARDGVELGEYSTKWAGHYTNGVAL